MNPFEILNLPDEDTYTMFRQVFDIIERPPPMNDDHFSDYVDLCYSLDDKITRIRGDPLSVCDTSGIQYYPTQQNAFPFSTSTLVKVMLYRHFWLNQYDSMRAIL